MVAVASFPPGKAKDLSAPQYNSHITGNGVHRNPLVTVRTGALLPAARNTSLGKIPHAKHVKIQVYLDHRDRRGAYKVLVKEPEREYLEDIGIDGKIILKGMFKKWTGMIWLRTGTGGRRL